MAKLLLLMILVVSLCRGFILVQNENNETSSEVASTLLYTFNDPKCSNPCWLGIELAVTNKEEVIAILEQHGIEFTLEGYSGDSIWLHNIPGGLFPDGDIVKFTHGWIGVDPDGPVHLITFDLDLCVSTLLRAYGEPSVWDGILVYVDHQLFFSVDWKTHRVSGVALHLKEAIPPQIELEDWAKYASNFSDDCSDVLTRHED